VYEIIAIDTPSLGDRSYLVHDGSTVIVIDPQRDIDRVLDLAEERGVHVAHVFETHIHNDYVSGGLALSGVTGAAYYVNRDDPVSFDREPVSDGDLIEVAPSLRVRVIATPGHTFTHLSLPPPTAWRATCRPPRGCSPPTASGASARPASRRARSRRSGRRSPPIRHC